MAFKRGDSEKALQLFLALEKKSPKPTPQITLNIALLYLQSAKLSLAQEYFTRLAMQPKWAMLAHYYLGLLAYRNDERALAKHLLTRVVRETGNSALREKARLGLGQLQGPPSMAVKTRGQQQIQTSYYLSYMAGFEDNALALPGDQLGEKLPAEDSYHELFIQGDLSVTDSLELNAYVTARNYQEYADLSSSILNLGLEYEFLMLGGRRTATFNMSEIRADDTVIYDQWQGTIASPFVLIENQLDASFSVQQILANTDFQFLDGYQYKLALTKDWSILAHTLALDYAYEINNRTDLTTTDEFSSFSPRRHSLELSDEFSLSEKLEFNASLRVVDSQWRGTNRTLDESDNIISAKRKADQYQYTFSVLYYLAKKMTLSTSYQYLDHNENIDTNSYANSLVSVMFSYEG